MVGSIGCRLHVLRSSPVSPATAWGLSWCFSSDGHQGRGGGGGGKKTQGKNPAFVYEQSLIIKAPGWRSRKRPSHLSCLLTPGSSGGCFCPRAKGSGGNRHDGDSTSRDLGGSHHGRVVWGHPGDCRGELRGSPPTSHLPRCLGTPCCLHHLHLHGQQRERGPPARSTTQATPEMVRKWQLWSTEVF